MNKILFLSLLAATIISCTKKDVYDPIPQPDMHYVDLHNAEIGSGNFKSVDINADGTTDFSFGTLLVGDPLLKRDRLQFYAYSFINTNLAVNDAEETPALSRDEKVTTVMPGYTWYQISAIVLAEKITPLNGAVYWDGKWKTAAHKYLPVQVEKNSQLFNGWIELSFDTVTQKLTLHRAGISRKPGVDVIAGR